MKTIFVLFRTCVPAYLRTCVPAYLRTCDLRTCVPAYLRTCVVFLASSMFSFLASQTLSDPNQTLLLPEALEASRLQLIIKTGIVDDYSDFGSITDINFNCMDHPQTLPGDGSPTKFPINSPIHAAQIDLIHNWLGVKSFVRHGARSDHFFRAPYCANNEQYYNGLLEQNGLCNDITTVSSPLTYTGNLVATAHSNDMQIGFYLKNSCDFFYETQHITAGPLFETGDGVSLCRRKKNNDEPNTYYQSSPHFNLSNVGYSDLTGLAIIPTILDTDCPVPHYECINKPDWRTLSLQRVTALRTSQSDFLFFDEWLMPEVYLSNSPGKLLRGCWCSMCREKQCVSTTGASNVSCMTQHVAYLNPTTFAQKKAMSKLFTQSITEHLTALRTAINAPINLGETTIPGSVCIHSVVDLSALNNDSYRTEFAAAVDVPKTEWSLPTLAINNHIFWNHPDPDPNIPINQIWENKWPLLGNHRIPTYLRTSVGLSVARDASPSRLVYTWTGNEPFDNGPASLNNKKFYHTQGFAYAIGSIMSITTDITPIASSNENGVGPYIIHGNARFLSNNIGVPNPSVEAANNIRVFDADAFYGGVLRKKRPLVWISVLFSEVERNRYLYADNILAQDQNLLNSVSTIPAADQHEEAKREALAWLNHLLPVHAAYQSLFNSCASNGNLNTTYKFPVSIINDKQVLNKITRYAKSIIVPLPLDINPSVYLDNSVPNGLIVQEIEDGLESNLIPKIFIGNNNGNWFSNMPTPLSSNQEDEMAEIRNSILGYFTPPIYVVGTSEPANGVIAGFLTNPNAIPGTDVIPDVTVVLSNDPDWGLLKGWRDDLDWWKHFPIGTPETVPLSVVGNNDLTIRIPISPINPLLLGLAEGCTPQANIVNVDGSITPLAVTTNLPDLPIPASYGQDFVISVPSFTDFVVVHIKTTCE